MSVVKPTTGRLCAQIQILSITDAIFIYASDDVPWLARPSRPSAAATPGPPRGLRPYVLTISEDADQTRYAIQIGAGDRLAGTPACPADRWQSRQGSCPREDRPTSIVYSPYMPQLVRNPDPLLLKRA
jgi:hypothetical protein